MPLLRSDGTGISTIRALSLKRCGIGDAGEESSIFHKYINMVLLLRCYFRWKCAVGGLCAHDFLYKNTDFRGASWSEIPCKYLPTTTRTLNSCWPHSEKSHISE
ncbi:expressed unknown protein [Ectocarpus siliculosus]|uniref:Uncharacterized protein n=1 Tax=Ectocarpus siliculosus TaxID=2880 RepID=D7FW80_ECTSI|nr:expressed unknown protein [Ectocarpus siliculosus]|eukprot:CBJ25600.1 expressed unknown protein [Ectocarpus siliculosus]